MLPSYSEALSAWQRIVGAEHVFCHPDDCHAAAQTTFLTHQQIHAVIRPSSTPEVAECLKVAHQFKIPLYPVSTGKNWGYGSAVPASNDNVLLSLARMNRILEFNEKLAYVTVEPGVTQKQLYEFLKEKKSRLWMDVTGASENCSLIGNAIERGFGHTPYGDHFDHVCGLEVVLATGEILQTGFRAFPASKAGRIYKWGLGPYLDGIFSQSNFAVVTRMTFWLMPEPESFSAFYAVMPDDKDLTGVFDGLAELRRNMVIPSAVHVANHYKVINAAHLYPWDKTGGKTPLDANLAETIAREYEYGAWNVSGALYGLKQTVCAAQCRVRKILKGKARKIVFLNDRKLSWIKRLAPVLDPFVGGKLSRRLALIEPIYGLNKGIPTDAMMKSVYWRKRTELPKILDPDKDQCGLIWVNGVGPLEGRCAREVADTAQNILNKFRFEPMISLTMITPRAFDAIISINYDRNISGEDVRAMNCHDELMKTLMALGYYPYRLGIQSMGKVDGASEPMKRVCKELKNVFDPHHVIAPGRYEF